MARSETIYLGRENRLVRELTRAGSALSDSDQAAITRVQAHIGTTCLDTDEATDPISYTGGVVTMQPGLASTLEAGESTCYLTVYDNDHADGLAWGSFPVEIIDWPTCEVTP